MINEPELTTIAAAGRPAARATARVLATLARSILARAEALLEVVDDEQAKAAAREAGEATTKLIVATYDGPSQVFACKR